MRPSLAGYGWVARARANKASSCQISLLHEGEDVWSGFQATETTSQVAVPKEPEAAQSLLGPMGNLGRGENLGSAAILSQDALGLRFDHQHCFPLQNAAPRSTVGAISEIGLGGALPRWLWSDCKARANRASSCQISLLHEGEDVWSWCRAGETTSQAAVPKEPEAAQTLLGPMWSIGLGEN